MPVFVSAPVAISMTPAVVRSAATSSPVLVPDRLVAVSAPVTAIAPVEWAMDTSVPLFA